MAVPNYYMYAMKHSGVHRSLTDLISPLVSVVSMIFTLAKLPGPFVGKVNKGP